METIYLGDRKLSVRTSVLEEKATACNMLCCYADELKEGFYPYVEQARPHALPMPSLAAQLPWLPPGRLLQAEQRMKSGMLWLAIVSAYIQLAP